MKRKNHIKEGKKIKRKKKEKIFENKTKNT